MPQEDSAQDAVLDSPLRVDPDSVSSTLNSKADPSPLSPTRSSATTDPTMAASAFAALETRVGVSIPDDDGMAVRCSIVEPLAPTLASSASQEEGDVKPRSDRGRRFNDEGEIARGGMGQVRRVMHTRLLRHEAMKLPEETRSPRHLARFIEEAQITGQLDHPNIVPVYDLGFDEDANPAFFTMKLVKGKTLGALLASLGDERLVGRTLERVVQILLRVCDAVSFAHSRGVVHCDLKPENVMVGSHNQVYVMDWGLAVLRASARPSDSADDALVSVDSGAKELASLVGTPAYMAPEQAWARSEDIDARTDVYALGGVLYRLLTGRPPHTGETTPDAVRHARSGRITPPQEVSQERKLPPELCRIAMKALEHERERRYTRVVDFRDDLEAFLRGGGWLETRTFAKGTVIVREGEAAGEAYIVVEGRCEAFKTIGDKRVVLRTMGAGEVFGETAVLTAQPRTASVEALDEVTVKVVTNESLEHELHASRWTGAFVRALAERFREIDEQLTDLRRKQG